MKKVVIKASRENSGKIAITVPIEPVVRMIQKWKVAINENQRNNYGVYPKYFGYTPKLVVNANSFAYTMLCDMPR